MHEKGEWVRASVQERQRERERERVGGGGGGREGNEDKRVKIARRGI